MQHQSHISEQRIECDKLYKVESSESSHGHSTLSSYESRILTELQRNYLFIIKINNFPAHLLQISLTLQFSHVS
jgi:hypothetical protein